jgi:hypothetical protein
MMCFQLIIGHTNIVSTLLGVELFGTPFTEKCVCHWETLSDLIVPKSHN